ncbi:MAG TPA: AarF/ABC1/UbiB kinase family protein [Dehalococcoidia bacterium]|nr:AarF/ABC1/UbiB kinase family protein [Dehalococcoidia bacterium]
MTTTSDYVPPSPIAMPRVGAFRKGRRLVATGATFGRHLAPALVAGLTRRGTTHVPRAIRRAFEDLGSTYVKFGQFAGSVPDIVGHEVAAEFRSCLDAGPPVPFEQVRAVVEEDLGDRIGRLFASFDEQPVAAASISVVHRATLPGGERVAVKVLRPGVEHLVATDLALLQAPIRFFALQGLDRAMALLSYLIGFQEQVAEELDLRNEARTMDYFRALLADLELSRLHVPHVHHRLSSRRVLTMELLDGSPIDDLAEIEARGLDPRPFVRQLMQAWILTAMYVGVFHADIHAGNLLLTRDGRLGMLDWGIVARLDPDTHTLVRSILEAALGIRSAWDELTAAFIRMHGASLRDGLGLSDEQIRRVVRELMEPVLTRPVGEVSMASLFGTSEEAIAIATGEPPRRRSLAGRWRLLRKTARTNRMKLSGGVLDSGFERASFLAAKQVVYLERYWKAYMPDEPLLADHDFLRAVLAHGGKDGGHAVTAAATG